MHVLTKVSHFTGTGRHAAVTRIFGLISLEGRYSMSLTQVICAILVPLLWGYQYVPIKVGLSQFPPLFFLALRFIAIALLLIPFVSRPTRKQCVSIMRISIFVSTLNFGLMYTGIGLGTATHAAVAYQLSTPFIILLSWPMLGERPSLRAVIGILTAFVGVVLASGGRISGDSIAILFVVLAAFSYALGNVMTKRYGPDDPLMLLAWMSLFTVPTMLLGSFVLEHGQLQAVREADLRGWACLTYTVVIGGIAGFGMWFWLISQCTMNRVAPFGLLMPVFGVLSSVVFLGDRLSMTLIIGAVLTFIGVVISQRKAAPTSLANSTPSPRNSTQQQKVY